LLSIKHKKMAGLQADFADMAARLEELTKEVLLLRIPITHQALFSYFLDFKDDYTEAVLLSITSSGTPFALWSGLEQGWKRCCDTRLRRVAVLFTQQYEAVKRYIVNRRQGLNPSRIRSLRNAKVQRRAALQSCRAAVMAGHTVVSM
jgi:hypothetical protein